MVHHDAGILVPYLQVHVVIGQSGGLGTPEFIQIQRRQQNVLEGTGSVSHRVGNLENALSGETTDNRLHNKAPGLHRSLEVITVCQVEYPTRLQRVAMQLAVGQDCQQTGVLRMLPQDVGEKCRTGSLVSTSNLRHISKAKQQLGGTADTVVEFPRNRFGAGRQLFPGPADGVGPVVQQHPQDGENRQQRRCQYQQQDADPQAHNSLSLALEPNDDAMSLISLFSE